jgi:glycosyltransferase involved in cell wall biosynthesis
MNKRAKHIVIDARIRRSSTGRYVDRLLEHLQAVDHYHRYTVLVQPDDTWKPRAKNFRAVSCRFSQFSFNPLDQFAFSWQLYRLRPDLVHFTMTQQPLLYFGHIVTTTHDLTMLEFVRRGDASPMIYWFKIHLYRFLLWNAHHKSDRIIVPTRTVAQEIAKLQPFATHKLAVTYEASEPPIEAAAEQPNGVSGDFLLYVGTAFPHKNLKRLIEAFDILHEQRPNLHLVLTGKTEIHYEELAAWAQDRHSFSAITFTGYVSDASLKWLYQHCKAYVFASLSEGFGLPPLEAMTYGAPVAASNASCIPEVCGAAAHYFDARKPKDMATKISDVLDDTALRDLLIHNGREQLKKYSWRHMAQETLIIYKVVLES